MVRLFMITALTLLALPNSAAGEQTGRIVIATTLDGSTMSGELTGWSEEEVTLLIDEQQESLSTGDLLSLRWAPVPDAAALQTAGVELIDGTALPIEDFTRQADGARLTLHGGPDGEAKELAVPIRTVAAVRLQPLAGDVATQWDEIREHDFVGDVLVVLQRDGQSLDYIEGVLGDVTDAHVEFNLDEELLRVDRERVGGMIYFRRAVAAGQSDGHPRCVVHGRGGLRAHVNRVELSNGRVQMTTISGVALTWPLDDIYLADFSAGKVAFLSDLEPVSHKWIPLVALPASAELASEYGRTRRDQSAYGGPLAVRYPGDVAAGIAPHEETFAKGLAIRSRTEVVYRLPAGYRRLLATAGIEPATSSRGDVLLTIEGDGRTLLEAQVAGDQSPLDIELDVEGVRRLMIVVDYGENLDTGDWLNFCNARVVK